MAKRRSPTLDYLVYVVVRGVVCVVQMLSWRQAQALARVLAWLAYHLNKRHRRVAHANLRHAFGDRYSDAERDALVRDVYTHFSTMLLEILLLPRKIHVTNYKRSIQLRNCDELLHRMFRGQALQLLTAHFGNWEIAGFFTGLSGFRSYAVARALDNPYVDRFFRKFREYTGQTILAKKGDFDQMTELLAAGGILATLGDQDAGARGLFVDFFGRPASSHKAIALMAAEFNTPMYVALTVRTGGWLSYRIEIVDTIIPAEYAHLPDRGVRAMTQRYCEALEKTVRQYPEQYFWLHNRWKHQPAPRKAKRSAA